MAERIVSPGVFTREKDLSFLPQGVAEIGAVLIGQTIKGPAFVPTRVESFNDFQQKFGGLTEDSYLPYTAQAYLQDAPAATIVRVLGTGGYNLEKPVVLIVSSSAGEKVAAVLHQTTTTVNGNLSGSSVTSFTGAVAGVAATASLTFAANSLNDGNEVRIPIGGVTYRFIASDSPVPNDGSPIFFFATGSALADSVDSLRGEINGANIGLTANNSSTTLQLTASSVGTTLNGAQISTGSGANSSSVATFGGGINAVLGGNTPNADSFLLTVAGGGVTSEAITASMDPTSINYFTKTYGYLPKSSKNAYTYLNFNTFQSASIAVSDDAIVKTASFDDFDFTNQYSVASTPYIKSQKVGGVAKDLFKFHTLSHGNSTNYEIKVGIRDIKVAGDVPGSDYGSFTVILRRIDTSKIPYSIFGQGVQDTDTRPNILEQFSNVNLDPNSPNYIKRVIGDRYITVDGAGKLSTNGDYANNSVYIRVEVDSDVEAGAIDSSLVPFGFGAVTSPIPSTVGTVPSPTYVVSQSLAGSYNKNVYLGYSFDFVTTDNLNFLNPLPKTDYETVGTDFDLQDCSSNGSVINLNANATTAQLDARKFMIPFQGGFDGFQPNRIISVGNDIVAGNTQGLDCSSVGAAGTTALRKAINAVSNPDEFDMNMIVIPGVINRLHSSVTTYAKDLCEDRGDTFFVMDAGGYTDNISTVVNSLSSFDSNYVATYHPWVKILDTDKNKPVWVPPSVVLPGVIAFNDQVAAEWFAPAGLNRGGLTNVIEVKTRLTHSERDELYVGRVNPIATFPGQGATVFGQKTLQAKPSALDRINVRRLLIAVKKFIASSSRYLLFENNTAATRNRFLSIVNPYLESIQQRNGLYAFRVVMDESNNTPDIIDRNVLKGDIFLQPAKTAEFIVLDFTVLPTGAAFPEG